MVRIALVILSLVAPFTVPWPYAVVLGLAASYFVPAIALVIGAVFEVMYGTGSMPYAFIAGIAVFVLMFGVRRFVKTRIMDA